MSESKYHLDSHAARVHQLLLLLLLLYHQIRPDQISSGKCPINSIPIQCWPIITRAFLSLFSCFLFCHHLSCAIVVYHYTCMVMRQLWQRNIWIVQVSRDYSNMSAPVRPSPYRKISAEMWSTYIGEAIQLGNHRKYCREHNLSYSTFNDKFKFYIQSTDTCRWQREVVTYK